MSDRDIFSVVDSFVERIQDVPELWNDDPVERAKSTYTGFRTIKKNFVVDDFTEKSFPVLVLDPRSEHNLSTGHGESTPISFDVMCRVLDNIKNIASDESVLTARKNAHRLLRLLIKKLRVKNDDETITPIDVIKSFKVGCSGTYIELN